MAMPLRNKFGRELGIQGHLLVSFYLVWEMADSLSMDMVRLFRYLSPLPDVIFVRFH